MAEKKKGFDLAAALGSVSSLDTGIEGREQIEYIDIDRIRPDERNFYELGGIDELAASIEFAGLQQPLRVRPGEEEGVYIIVSGHRRHAALSQLAKEGNEKFRQAACIVERWPQTWEEPGQNDEVAQLLQELRLIYGNSDTRRMSSADISRQAERVEMLLYQLKEAGVEFPGKMRDHVAEACKVSASKLARLKVIREGLTDLWRAHFEDGSLVESSAYELARIPKDIQDMAHEAITNDGKTKVSDIPTWKYSGLVDTVKSVRDDHCEKNGDGHCERLDERLKTAIKDGRWSDCARCCSVCHKLATCKKVCEPCRELAKKKAEDLAILKAKEAERKRERQEEEERMKAWALKGWIHLGKALKAADMSIQKFAELDDIYWDDEDIALAEKAMRGIDVSKDWYPGEDHPMIDLSFFGLVELADKLRVSIDYLLCRTDEPREVWEIKKEVREWHGRGETPPEGEIIITYDLTNDGPKYTPAVWDGRRFHAPGKPNKELTGLGQQFTKWTLLPEDE